MLTDLATEHPGGWKDVIDTISQKWPDLTIEIQDYTWGMTTKIEEDGKIKDTGIMRLNRSARAYARGEYVLHLYLKGLDHGISGILASMAHRALRLAGLPVSGDPEWRQPARTWRRRNA